MIKFSLLYFYIANYLFEIRVPENKLFKELKKSYLCIEGNQMKSDFTIYIKKSDNSTSYVQKKTRGVYVYFFSKENYVCVQIFLMIKLFIVLIMLKKNVYIFHASTIAKGGKAHVFSGMSGAGKSTILRHVSLGDRLGDDSAVIALKKGKLFCYTSPFDNLKVAGLEYRKCPMASFFFIKQSIRNNIRVSSLNVSQRLIKSISFFVSDSPVNKPGVIKKRESVLSLEKKLAINGVTKYFYKKINKLVPFLNIYELSFRKDCSFLSNL